MLWGLGINVFGRSSIDTSSLGLCIAIADNELFAKAVLTSVNAGL